jgi:hypothetical protein
MYHRKLNKCFKWLIRRKSTEIDRGKMKMMSIEGRRSIKNQKINQRIINLERRSREVEI